MPSRSRSPRNLSPNLPACPGCFCRVRPVVYDNVFEEHTSPARTEVNAMPAATPQPESQEDLLDAALAALTEADIPPDDADWAPPDPDSGRPAELAGMSAAELEALLAASPAT